MKSILKRLSIYLDILCVEGKVWNWYKCGVEGKFRANWAY